MKTQHEMSEGNFSLILQMFFHIQGEKKKNFLGLSRQYNQS